MWKLKVGDFDGVEQIGESFVENKQIHHKFKDGTTIYEEKSAPWFGSKVKYTGATDSVCFEVVNQEELEKITGKSAEHAFGYGLEQP